MKKVYKYPLIIEDYQKVKMPLAGKILTVALQEEIPCIWALVDSDQKEVERIIRIAGTGHPMNDYAVYIGTFLMLKDRLVFHVFEVVPLIEIDNSRI